MEIKDFSEKEIERVVNSFKAYIKVVVTNAKIDYARKVQSQKYKMVSYNENIEKELMSLSNVDSDIFLFNEIGNNKNIFWDSRLNFGFNKLTEKERKVLELYIKEYKPQEISEILQISKTNVTTIKNRAVTKLKKYVKEVNK